MKPAQQQPGGGVHAACSQHRRAPWKTSQSPGSLITMKFPMHKIEKQQPDIVVDDVPVTVPGPDKHHLDQRIRQFLIIRKAKRECPQLGQDAKQIGCGKSRHENLAAPKFNLSYACCFPAL